MEDSRYDILKGKSKAVFAVRTERLREGASRERLLAALWLWLQSVWARHDDSPGGSEQRPVVMFMLSPAVTSSKQLFKNRVRKESSALLVVISEASRTRCGVSVCNSPIIRAKSHCSYSLQKLCQMLQASTYLYAKIIGQIMVSLRLYKPCVISLTETGSPWQSFPMLLPLQMSWLHPAKRPQGKLQAQMRKSYFFSQ